MWIIGYRSTNQELIEEIAAGTVPIKRLKKDDIIKTLMLQERNLFDKHVQPYLLMGTTAKVPQIEELAKYYAPDKHVEVILIDDAKLKLARALPFFHNNNFNYEETVIHAKQKTNPFFD